MNQNGPSDTTSRSDVSLRSASSQQGISRLAKFCFVAWIVATMVVYFLAFGTRYVVSLFGRIGLESVGEWFGWLNDGLMTWFSNKGG